MKKIPCLFICLTLLLASCHRERNARHFSVLTRLDSISEINPNVVADSLARINTDSFSRFNRGYYHLLGVIVKDKNTEKFTSDSVINQAAEELKPHRRTAPLLYARALLYQGIVRYRLARTDSAAYAPMKKAVEIIKNLKKPDYKTLDLACYYLGQIHDAYFNTEEAYNYYKQSIHYANQAADTIGIFYNYTAMFWNRLTVNEHIQADSLLISLQGLNDLTKIYQHDILNMQSSLYTRQKKFAQALNIDLKLEKDSLTVRNPVNIRATNYSLSENYYHLRQYNKSLEYAQKAVNGITDTAFTHNYLYYKQLADAAAKCGEWQTAANAYRKAMENQKNTIDKQLDTQVLELEKKYDFTATENAKLEAENNRRLWIVISLIIALIAAIIWITYLRINTRQKQVIENKQKELEFEKRIIRQKQNELNAINSKNRWINTFYAKMATVSGEVQEMLYPLQHTKNKSLSEVQTIIEKILEDSEKRIKKIAENAMSEEDFMLFTGLTATKSGFLNENEKLLITLLACGLNYAQIATLTHRKYDAVRISVQRLHEKTEKLEINTEKIKPYLKTKSPKQ